MIIDRRYFERWADTPDAKAGTAELVLQLVLNTLPNDGSSFDIPIGSATYLGGWDGLVNSVIPHNYIPQGKSGWEFGARNDYENKATTDYNKRTQAFSDDERKEMTFVFVTPYHWSNKDNWVSTRKAQAKWKNILVYDSEDLSQWIYDLPVVTEWFAQKINLFTGSDIILPTARWNEISIGPKGIILTPRFYTAGRERIIDIVQNMVEGKPGLQAFRASSREEAMAFILAAGQLLPEPARSKFIGKSVVVESRESFRNITGRKNAINIVTHLDDNSSVYSATTNNVVLVALGPDDEFRQDVIDLPVSERHALVEELVSYGVAEPEANRIVLTNSCNLTLIRKELGFPPVGAKWIGKVNLDELLPALLLGRWNENNDNDTLLLSTIAGVSSNQYLSILNQWLKLSVSPLTKTGVVWRLTSPLMLWTELSPRLSPALFDKIQNVFRDVFIEAKEKYSNQLKEGLLQTYIIIALYGNRLKLPIGDAQEWVDGLITKLLHDALPEKWVEISDFLPKIAEASPDVFLSELQLSIEKQTPVITALFEESNGFLFPQSHHTSLLWALEALAWHPKYLEPVTRILLRLTEMDPGGRLSNRPFNSLVDIYLPWKPHTSVELEGRLSILDAFINEENPVMWRLLIAMLPHPGSVTSGTYKLKWRDYEFTEEQGYIPINVNKTTEWAVTRLMTYFDGDDKKLSSLINAMEPIGKLLRNKLICWLPEAVDRITGSKKETGNALRETLWYQNLDGIKDRYSFTEEEVKNVREAYDKTIPDDLEERYIWLFDDYYPHLPYKSDENEEDGYLNDKQIERLRREACESLLNNIGEDRVIALKDKVKEPQTLGATLAFFASDNITPKVCKLLATGKDTKFTRGYIAALELQLGGGFVTTLYGKCEKNGFTNDELTSLLLCFEQNKPLWDYIETLNTDIQNAYWQRVLAVFWGGYSDLTLYKISKLSTVGRGLDAMNNSWIYAKEMPTAAIQELLQNVLRSEKDLNDSIDHHPLSVFLETLHKREDADKDMLMHLEWVYLPVLRYDRTKDSLALLNERLCSDPAFVVEVLSYLYVAETDAKHDKEVTDIERQNAQRAFYLLNQWKQVPGAGEDNTLDENVLSAWMEAVLKKSSEVGYYRHACSQLGQLFAHFPEWTDDAEKLFALMEPIEEKSFYSSYNVGLFNKRGFTSRGPYEGGDIERGNVATFKGLYEKYHKRFPRVSKVFKDLYEQYERMAKEMDDEAEITKLDY